MALKSGPSAHRGRPNGFTAERWSELRRAWIAAPDTVTREALALEYGMSGSTLYRWAKTCGWPRGFRNSGAG